MRTLLRSLPFAACMAVAMAADPPKLPAEWTTPDGQVLENPVVQKWDAAFVTILHDGGVARVPLSELPSELQQAFGYDPAKAAEVSAQAAKVSQTKAVAAQLDDIWKPWNEKLKEYKVQLESEPVRILQSGGTSAQANSAREEAKTSIENTKATMEIMRAMVAKLRTANIPEKDIRQLTDSVLEGKIYVGMPKMCVVLSWGRPDDKNSTVGEHGSHEQWIYRTGRFDANYVYFDERDIVTSIQN